MSKNKSTPEKTAETSNDLEQLRAILYGNQARATEKRMTDLEARLETVRQELNDSITERVSSAAGSSASELAKTRQELSDQLARQQADSAAQNKAWEERLDRLSTDLNKKLDHQINKLRQRLDDFRAETRQRNDDLRQEMLALGALLDNQKAGRAELGQLLVELGQQLQNNQAKKTAAGPGKE